MTILPILVVSVMLNGSVAAPDVCAPVAAKYTEALEAQDEVIALLTAQVAELKAAVAARTAAEEARQREIAALTQTVDTYKKLWLAEAEFTAAERRRSAWSERMTAAKWGLLGLAGGVLVERVVE